MFWDPLAIKNVLGNNMSTQSWFKTDEPAPNSKMWEENNVHIILCATMDKIFFHLI